MSSIDSDNINIKGLFEVLTKINNIGNTNLIGTIKKNLLVNKDRIQNNPNNVDSLRQKIREQLNKNNSKEL
tara:strand:+ start:791 stop:1003 length:213 start_codon:yes stop_codon:yes gene_type:complete